MEKMATRFFSGGRLAWTRGVLISIGTFHAVAAVMFALAPDLAVLLEQPVLVLALSYTKDLAYGGLASFSLWAVPACLVVDLLRSFLKRTAVSGLAQMEGFLP